jgi:hypothetical protein
MNWQPLAGVFLILVALSAASLSLMIAINQEFDEIEANLTAISTDLDAIEVELNAIEEGMTGIERRLDVLDQSLPEPPHAE